MRDRPIAILDIETDPFKYGRIPRPFAVGVYTPENWRSFWGSDCIEQSLAYLGAWSQEWIVLAHNGGKFDFMYYLPAIGGALRIINGRIVSCKCAGHEFRDSYAILPFPLKDYQKDEIDYRKFEADVREQHRTEILEYLHGDCKYLYKLVTRFYQEFGQKYLTVGSVAMSQIKLRHEVTRTKLSFDRVFRKDYFFGGRVQCFESGVLDGEFSIFDINSMYPDRMRNCLHPADECYTVGNTITDDTCFLSVEGRNYGAFPSRPERGGLAFDTTAGTYTVSRFEYDAAIATGTFIPKSIRCTFDFEARTSFSAFVDFAFDSRALAKLSNDQASDISWKYVANSGYGKFCQNPANFSDWKIAPLANRPLDACPHCKGGGECLYAHGKDACYKCSALNDFVDTYGVCQFCGGDGMRWKLHEYDGNNPDAPMLWSARTFNQSYYNVATGASITGAARAKLLTGLSLADKPIYCDTDSIITRGGFRGDVGNALGQWKLEGTGTVAAIAGKKLYCIFSETVPEDNAVLRRKCPWMFTPVKHRGRTLWPIKKAHKGFKLTPADILSVAQGNEIEVPNEAPSFGIMRNPNMVLSDREMKRLFIKRRARRTA